MSIKIRQANPTKSIQRQKPENRIITLKKLHMEYKENLALKEGKTHIKLTLKMKEKKRQNKTRKRQRQTATQDSK